MPQTKTYTLDLTEQDLCNIDSLRGRPGVTPAIVSKLHALADEAKADRKERDLGLPWGVFEAYASDPKWVLETHFGWKPGMPPGPPFGQLTLAQAKLAAAAPELLEAVMSIRAWIIDAQERNPHFGQGWLPTIEKALRKVETGIPE